MLQYGNEGDEVFELQRKINAWRAERGITPPIAVDGKFYGQTDEAVKQFQAAQSIEVDGLVGDETSGKIIAVTTPVLSRQPIETLAPAVNPAPEATPAPAESSSFFNFANLDLSDIIPFLPSAAFASVPSTNRTPVPSTPIIPDPETVAPRRPAQVTNIYAADILAIDQFDQVMRRAGMKPQERNEFIRGIEQLAKDINDLHPSMRGPVILAAREMYLAGHPVRFDSDQPPMTSTNDINARLVPVNRERYNRGDLRAIDHALENHGLNITESDVGGVSIGVNREYTNLDELRADLEAEHGGEPIRPIFPVLGGHRLSSGFGERTHPKNGHTQMHEGMDIAPSRTNKSAGNVNLPIVSAMPGRVRFAGNKRDGYGNQIEIEDIYGVVHRYAHLQKIDPDIRRGEIVQQGEPIGRMGTTGDSTGEHLHYEQIVGRSRGRDVRRDPAATLRALETEREPRRAVVPTPRQLGAATEQVITEQVAAVERRMAAGKEAMDAAVAKASEARDQAVETVSNVIGGAISGASRFLRGGRA